MTDRDNDPYLPRPKRTRAIMYIMLLIVFSAVYFVVLSGDSSEEQTECDPDKDFTCIDPSKIIVRFIANYHFMLWYT